MTERAWDNPKFVEDSVRDLANTLDQQKVRGTVNAPQLPEFGQFGDDGAERRWPLQQRVETTSANVAICCSWQ